MEPGDLFRRQGLVVNGEAPELAGIPVAHFPVAEHRADGEIGAVLSSIIEGTGPEIGVQTGPAVEFSIEINPAPVSVEGERDLVPFPGEDRIFSDGGLHAVEIAGAGPSGGGEVPADLVGAFPNTKIEKEAILARFHGFIPHAGHRLALAVAFRFAFDPGDEGKARVFAVKVEGGAGSPGQPEPLPFPDPGGGGAGKAVIGAGDRAVHFLQRIGVSSFRNPWGARGLLKGPTAERFREGRGWIGSFGNLERFFHAGGEDGGVTGFAESDRTPFFIPRQSYFLAKADREP